ncbi:hypothetical protein D3C76_1441940 [compost metagenome]
MMLEERIGKDGERRNGHNGTPAQLFYLFLSGPLLTAFGLPPSGALMVTECTCVVKFGAAPLQNPA